MCGPPPGSQPGHSRIDLALALVADDHGRRAAASVARQLASTSSAPADRRSSLRFWPAKPPTPHLRDLLSWLRDHLTDDLSVAALARQINLSERQFTRACKNEVGVTAADRVEAVRLDLACRLLEPRTDPRVSCERLAVLRSTARDRSPSPPRTERSAPDSGGLSDVAGTAPTLRGALRVRNSLCWDVPPVHRSGADLHEVVSAGVMVGLVQEASRSRAWAVAEPGSAAYRVRVSPGSDSMSMLS